MYISVIPSIGIIKPDINKDIINSGIIIGAVNIKGIFRAVASIIIMNVMYSSVKNQLPVTLFVSPVSTIPILLVGSNIILIVSF